jgi:hypothetical protein
LLDFINLNCPDSILQNQTEENALAVAMKIGLIQTLNLMSNFCCTSLLNFFLDLKVEIVQDKFLNFKACLLF